jgi:hypothetical protein
MRVEMDMKSTVWLVLCVMLVACTNEGSRPTLAVTSFAATPTLQPTPSRPIAHVGGSIPCFADARDDAAVLATVEIGDALEIMGEARGGHYWAVAPEDLDGYCWIQSPYVTTEGSTEHVTHLVPTLIPKPDAPAQFEGFIECRKSGRRWETHGVYANLSWIPSPFALEYRLIQDGDLIVKLPAGASGYSSLIAVRNKPYMVGAVTFELEALNDSGASEVARLELGYYCDFWAQ